MKNYYEVSIGAGGKMFTLWFNAFNTEGKLLRCSYRKNLSIDKDLALAEAKRYGDRIGVPVYDEAPDEARVIVYGEDVIRFGRYRDNKISNLPDQYLNWLFKNKAEFLTNQLAEFVETEMQKRGLAEMFEGRLLPKRLIEWILKDRQSDGHYYQNGEKVNLLVTVSRIKCVPNPFGYKSPDNLIITLIDKLGNKIIYKGSLCTYLDTTGFKESIQVGLTLEVSGKIEHTEYKERKQTRIMRPKFKAINQN